MSCNVTVHPQKNILIVKNPLRNKLNKQTLNELLRARNEPEDVFVYIKASLIASIHNDRYNNQPL